ncbi:MAG: GNAT family N-acetyltransferase [Hyphomonadaceae bacterium]|nr:GNAT family N-acetyltransferase [Hyphomonadaceae bacterium]
MSPLDIERATIRAWPAAETEERFGWFLLASGGVTGRVNAAWPLGWTNEASIDDAIASVEAWYAERNLPPRFKLTDAAFTPPDLPDVLARRGYAGSTHTLVMTRALSRFPDARAASDPGSKVQLGSVLGPGSLALQSAGERVQMSEEMPKAFDDALVASTPDPTELDERRSIAARMPKPRAYACIEMDGRAAAVGASAIADGLAGVFLMRTIAEARRRGCARRILDALLDWAAARDAHDAFLQVEADNHGAIELYKRAGFTTLSSYRFWKQR